MANKFSQGKGTGGENRGGRVMGAGGTGPSYSAGKNSAHARGVSCGRSGSSKVDVGYSKGKNVSPYGKDEMHRNRQPDPKGNKPFKQGGRA